MVLFLRVLLYYLRLLLPVGITLPYQCVHAVFMAFYYALMISIMLAIFVTVPL